MTPFTDDEKVKLRLQLTKTYYTANSVVEALLARLEAAEEVIRVVREMPIEDWDGKYWDTAIEVWRKAAGRDK